MSDFHDILIEVMRRQILCLLAAADAAPEAGSDGGLSCGMLQTALDLSGHRAGISSIHTQLRWLAEDERSLVSVRAVGADILIAHITRQGADVAAGRVRVVGVRRHAD